MEDTKLKSIIQKADKLQKGGEFAMAKELLDINEKQEETLQAIKDIPEAEPFPTKMRVELEGVNVITLKGLDGHTPTEDELQSLIKPLIPEPIKGDSYVLTKNDKVEIARSIKVPVVEKIIERTEVIKEQPIITNEIVEVAIHETPIEIKSKLETLKKDERLDKKAIKGLETMDTAIEILDQRTQFLINKTSTSSGGGVSSLNSLTGAVTLSAGANITLTPSGNDIQISSTGGGGSGWALTGNAGTTAGTNFIGTTDAQDLVFKVNTQEKLRILNTGSSNEDVYMTLGKITAGELILKFREDQTETFQVYSTKSGTDMTTTFSTYASSTSIMDFVTGNGTAGYIRLSPQTAVEIRDSKPLRFWDSGNNYVAFKAGTLSTDTTWTLPTTDSTGVQAMVSDGSGNLSWASIGGSVSWGDITGDIDAQSDLDIELSAKKNRAPTIETVASGASMTPQLEFDGVSMTSTESAGTLTINNSTGERGDGQLFFIRLKCTNVQTLSFGTEYVGGVGTGSTPLPTTTTGGERTDVFGFMYNEITSKLMCVSVAKGY